jgi:hypothetical protein
MLRKSAVSLLLFLYSLSAIGMPMHFHYCKGELKHVTLFVQKGCHPEPAPTSDHACCKSLNSHCDLGDVRDNCCDNSTEWLQDNAPTVCAKAFVLQDTPDKELVILSFCDTETIYSDQIARDDTETIHGSDPPLYLLHCSLIYYC